MDDAGTTYFLDLRRNNSLSRTERRRIFCVVCAVSFLIAAAFGQSGAWPVLPFAGLEMLVLYVAFRYIDRHAADYDRIEISGDMIQLESRCGATISTWQINRCWAQVVVSEGDDHHYRVVLRSHGEEWEVGRHLTDQDRLRVAGEIRKQLHRR